MSDPARRGGAHPPDFEPLHPTSATNTQVVRRRKAGAAPQLDACVANATVPFERMLRTLVDGTSHRDAARRVADEIAAMPTPGDLVAEIEALADA